MDAPNDGQKQSAADPAEAQASKESQDGFALLRAAAAKDGRGDPQGMEQKKLALMKSFRTASVHSEQAPGEQLSQQQARQSTGRRETVRSRQPSAKEPSQAPASVKGEEQRQASEAASVKEGSRKEQSQKSFRSQRQSQKSLVLGQSRLSRRSGMSGGSGVIAEEEHEDEELAPIPEGSERETPLQSISMDTWHRYERDRARYDEEMAAYEQKKAEYDQKMVEHSHIDFTVLDFMPEIRELSYYAKLKKKQKKADPRYQRTQALLRARAVDGGAGGFQCVDDPDADEVSAFSSQRMETANSAGRSAVGLSRRHDSEMQMEGGEEDVQQEAEAPEEADAAEPAPTEAAEEDGDAPAQSDKEKKKKDKKDKKKRDRSSKKKSHKDKGSEDSKDQKKNKKRKRDGSRKGKKDRSRKEEEEENQEEEEEKQPEISEIKELDEHLEQSKIEETPVPVKAAAPSEIQEEEVPEEEEIEEEPAELEPEMLEMEQEQEQESEELQMETEMEEEEEEEDEDDEVEAWPDDILDEDPDDVMESGTEPSFDMLMPVLLPADDLDEGAARDPVKEAREADRVRKIAERKAARRLLKERLAAEDARIEEERKRNMPPPPQLPQRFDFSFKETLIADGMEIDEGGDGFAATTDEPAVLLVNCPVQQQPYVVEDFPDPEAEDFPGQFVVVAPPEPPEPEEDEEVVAAAAVADAPDGDEQAQEGAEEEPEEQQEEGDDDLYAAAAEEVEKEDADKERESEPKDKASEQDQKQPSENSKKEPDDKAKKEEQQKKVQAALKNRFLSMMSVGKKPAEKPAEEDDEQMEGGAESDGQSSRSKAPSATSKLSKAERDAVRQRREQEKKERALRKAARDAKRKANEAKRQERAQRKKEKELSSLKDEPISERDEREEDEKEGGSEPSAARKPEEEKQEEEPPKEKKDEDDEKDQEDPKDEKASKDDQEKEDKQEEQEKPEEKDDKEKSEEKEQDDKPEEEEAAAAKPEDKAEEDPKEEDPEEQDQAVAPVEEEEEGAPEEEPEEAAAAAAPEDESEAEQEPAEPTSQWVFPPADQLPLKYQKNKYYYQYRIDELPEGEQAPPIIIGYSKANFDPEQDFKCQEDLWCMSLQTGDKFTRRKWKQYYEIDLENQAGPPRYGLFEAGTVIGVLLDTDRGAVSFYKDGNDLGLAFLSDDLKDGEFLPFIRTQCQCKLSLFSPKQYPWVADVPVEPAPPAEPTRDEEFLYSEMEEEQMKEDEADEQIGMSDDETAEVLFRDSMEYIDSDEERRLDAVVDAEHALLYDMRHSNRFYLDRTKANVMPPRESVPHRSSLRVRHRDLGLDGHTRQVKQAGLRVHDSQIYAVKDLQDCYDETLHLSQNRSDVIQPSNASEAGHPMPHALSNNQTMRPSATSSVYEKKKLDYLKQRQRNNKKQIQLLQLHLKLKNQMMELKQLEQNQLVEPDPALDPTMGHAYGLAMTKLKNGTLRHEEPSDKENCTIF